MFERNLPLSPEDIVVAVLGPTGAGKSYFVDIATNQAKGSTNVGHGLPPYTTSTRAVKIVHPRSPDRNIVFIDTPGFDESHLEVDVVKMISHFLSTDIKLAAIVYLHRITDNRMAGSPHKTLRIFRRFYMEDAALNVIFTTTMWNVLKSEDVGAQREQLLKDSYWRAMLDKGASFGRFHGTYESAWEIIDLALGERSNRPPRSPDLAAGQTKPLSFLQRTAQRLRRMSRLGGDSERNLVEEESQASGSGVKLDETPEDPKIFQVPIDTFPVPSRAKPSQRWSDRKTHSGHVVSVKVEELKPSDVIIALLGPTGAGKSSFICDATGGNIKVGHTLEPCTRDIQLFKLHYPDRSDLDVVFVDTPGTDSNSDDKPDAPMDSIIAWLEQSNIELSAILYLHRISDNHLAATAINHLRRLRSMCKTHRVRTDIHTTTMWDEVEEFVGSQREEELENWLTRINGRPAKTWRYLRTAQSAWDILDHCLSDVPVSA